MELSDHQPETIMKVDLEKKKAELFRKKFRFFGDSYFT